MKKKLLLAALLVVAGGLIVFSVLFAIDFDFSKLDSQKYERERFEVIGEFDRVSIDLSDLDLRILPAAEGEGCTLLLPKSKTQECKAFLMDGKLCVQEIDGRAWFEKLVVFSFADGEESTVELRLPPAEYSRLDASIRSGDITLEGEGYEFGYIGLNGSTGDVEISKENVTGMIKTTTGDVYVRGAKEGDLSISTTTGEVELSDCTLRDLSVEVSSGDVSLSDAHVTGEICVKTTTGDVDLHRVNVAKPSETSEELGGVLSITTTTGSIKADEISSAHVEWSTTSGSIKATGVDVYSANVKVTSGSVRIALVGTQSHIFNVTTSSGSTQYPESGAGGDFRVKTASGSVDITYQTP